MRNSDPGLLFILSGPAGAGKTTCARMLCEREPRCALSISATTRPRRKPEEDGRDYFFLNKEEFESRARRGEFAEHAEFSGHLYGTPRPFLEARLRDGKHVILDIEVKGAAQICECFPQAIRVFILPPTPETLVQRLTARNTEAPDEIARRMKIACGEISRLQEFDYLLVNADREETYKELRCILHAEEQRIRGGESRTWCDGRAPEDVLKVSADA